MLRRMLCLLLMLCLCGAARADGDYPTEWDRAAIYQSADDWHADYARAGELIEALSGYAGRLDDAQTLLDCWQHAHMSELTELQGRLTLYAYLGYYLDPADAEAASLIALLERQTARELELQAQLDAELYALPIERRRELLGDPLLEPYAYAMRAYVDEDAPAYNADALTAVAMLTPALGRAATVYDLLCAELPAPQATAPDGEVITLNVPGYSRVLNSAQYDRAFRIECSRVYSGRYAQFDDTFAALLDSDMALAWAGAQLDGYASTREATLAAEDVDTRVYDLTMEAARAGAGDYRRYLTAHARALGLEEQYPFDLSASASGYAPAAVSYAQAVENVRAALAVLGGDYLAEYDAVVTGGYVQLGSSGSMTLALGGGQPPYTLLTFNGTSDSVSTLAHELGHAVYARMATAAQPMPYQTAPVLNQEVAAAVNELLLCAQGMESAQTDDERLYWLEQALRLFADNMFTQAMYAGFEDAACAVVESGGALSAQTLGDIWQQQHALYRGDAVVWQDEARSLWAGVPHLYYNYYLYRYPAALCCATALCAALLEGEPGAAQAYADMLRRGGSAAPDELLRAAGVDPTDAATYARAMEHYSALVDEYERLIAARG